MTLIELRQFVENRGFYLKVRSNVIKISNYRDYVIYLYKNEIKNYIMAWDVCYGEHWANQQDKVFQKIIEFVNNYDRL